MTTPVGGVLTLAQRAALLGGVIGLREAMRLPWLTAELVSTPDARARLREWADLATFPVSQVDPAPMVECNYFGDDEMLAPVLDTFRRMPPPAARFVVMHAVFFGVGWTTNGWTGGSPRTLTPTMRVVVLSGATRDPDQVRRTALHEAAHVWLDPLPASLAPAASTTLGLELMTPEARAEHDGQVAEVERRVVRLAKQWDRGGGRYRFFAGPIHGGSSERRNPLVF